MPCALAVGCNPRENLIFFLQVYNFEQFCLAECIKIYQPTPDCICPKNCRVCVQKLSSRGNGCGWIDLPERPTGSQFVSEADRECVLRKEADREGKCLREGAQYAS